MSVLSVLSNIVIRKTPVRKLSADDDESLDKMFF